MPAPIVFFDIAGPDLAELRSFYEKVFGWSSHTTGDLSVPVSGSPLNGAFRADPADKVLYIGVEDIAGTLTQISELGGTVLARRFEVPGVVLGLFADPAGNSMGLVELADGKPKIP
jgi:predicted enzyme related to lactoylglutathione lyase